jgi:diguanylate cyclase (GGDEF)-like protein
MKRIRTIRGLLLSASIVFSIAMVTATYFVIAHLYDRSVRENSLRDAKIFARVTFNSMFQLMSTGWNRGQMEGFIAAIQKSVSDTEYQIEIYRGQKVDELFGAILQKAPDQAIQTALKTGESAEDDSGSQVRYIYALKAQRVCIDCHVNAKEGEALGVIDVKHSVVSAIDAHSRKIAGTILPLIPVALLATWFMVGYIRRRLDDSIDRLATDIRAVNRISDLSKLEQRPIDLGFAEFDRVSIEVRQLTERLRNVAVDKEMLEFEIRLLEKFILSSDVIRDWREYINRLLIEIDQVMPAYSLFSLFKIGDDALDLEVFWRYQPSKATTMAFEHAVRETLRKKRYFEGGLMLRIQHHVADVTREIPTLSEADIEVQTKALLVDIPKIGGIVGIGMQPQGEQDHMRLLVIESILTTLLSVVGSVKAIDKYTKDLEYYATRDPLTNLFNQRVFWELLENEAVRSARHDYSFSLLAIDVDNFKSVNDTYGHSVGDTFLQEITARIRMGLRDDDLLSRYGGDEFAVILPETGLEEAEIVARRVVQLINEMVLDGPDSSRLTGSVSIGMACYPQHAAAVKDLYLFADSMMYRAKHDGKNRVAVPTPDDVVEVFRTVGEKSMLILSAVESNGVIPFYQPIINVAEGHVEAIEVLSRIRLESGEFIIADEYVAIAEKMGVMHKLDYILMEKALAAVEATGYNGFLFLNMSPRALVLNDFVQETRRIASQFKVDPGKIVFEITERETIKNMAVLERFIHTLRGEGFKLAIDDFGSGFSSFHYVKRFPIDFLKIEGDFILGMKSSEKDRALVRSIMTLARDLKIRTVAEYVEDEAVLDEVRGQGIDLAQGYHIHRPDQSLATVMGIRVDKQ